MIVVLTNIPTPYRTAFFNNLSNYLTKQGIGFHVLYCAESEPRRFWEFNPEDQRYPYTLMKGYHPQFNNIYPHINIRVNSHLKKLKPNVIICAGAWNTPTVLLALYRFNNKIPKLFWSEAHSASQVSTNSLIAKLRKSVFNEFSGFLVPNKASERYIEHLLDRRGLKIGYLPNTIDENFFNIENCISLEQLRSNYNIKNKNKTIILISTLSRRKGVLAFAKAYKSFRETHRSRFNIFYCGTGDLHSELEKFITEESLPEIRLMGQCSAGEIRDLIHLSDIFALPTRLDPNPLTPIEASFMQTPVMLSQHAGNFNELCNENTGIPIKSVIQDDLLQALTDFDKLSQDELKIMGKEAYYNVIKNFTRDQVSINLISFLNANFDLS